MPGLPDYYRLLNLRRNATPEEIRSAYFEAARRLHPDRNTAPGETEFFLDIKQAYDVLSDRERRASYDRSLPPEEKSDSPIIQKVLYSRPSLQRSTEQQMIYVLLEIAPSVNPESIPTPPLNLCLILDRSTSMHGLYMDIMKTTAIQVLRKLRSQDIFSVVAFSDRAEVILPAGFGSDLSKLEARIQMMQTSGGTEIFQGLNAGFQQVQRNADKGHVNHIILLTDGRTYGDENLCMTLASQAANQGIGISGLGIGSEWNDKFLDDLASQTGGSSMYVSQPEDIQHLLLEKFDHLWSVYAEETNLKYDLPEGLALQYAFRLQPEVGLLPNTSPIRLGVIPRDGTIRVLMEFAASRGSCQGDKKSLLRGEIEVRVSSLPIAPPMVNLHLSRPISDGNETETPPQEIIDAVSKLTLYRIQEKAKLQVSAGNYEQASHYLQSLATHLLARGEKQLAKTALVEADQITKNQAFSKEGDKRIKYGTRSLLMGKEKKV